MSDGHAEETLLASVAAGSRMIIHLSTTFTNEDVKHELFFSELRAVILLLGSLCKHLETTHEEHCCASESLARYSKEESETATPFTTFHHSGISSSQSFMMKNATHIQLDVVAFLLCFKQIERARW